MDIISKRYSCRKFVKDYHITEEEIAKLVDSIRLSPSAGNCQDVFTYVIRNQEKKDIVGNIYFKGRDSRNENFFNTCSAIFVLFGASVFSSERYGERAERYSILDTGIAAENLCLCATSMGLGSVIIGAFNDNKIAKEILGADFNRITAANAMEPLLIVPVGKPISDEIPKKRREPIENRFIFID